LKPPNSAAALLALHSLDHFLVGGLVLLEQRRERRLLAGEISDLIDEELAALLRNPPRDPGRMRGMAGLGERIAGRCSVVAEDDEMVVAQLLAKSIQPMSHMPMYLLNHPSVDDLIRSHQHCRRHGQPK
jgi:hypothetical protein